MKRLKIVKNARAAVGIVVTILVFLVALSVTTVIFVQYNAFIQDTNRAAEKATAKANEKLIIQAIPKMGEEVDPNDILIENIGKGPETSEIVAILVRDTATLQTKNYTLSQPVTVKLTEAIRVNVTKISGEDNFEITEGFQVGVLTSLGNVFWGFTVKVTFIAYKLSPNDTDLASANMIADAEILTVDGVHHYTVRDLFPEERPPGVTILWPAGSQHQFIWFDRVEADPNTIPNNTAAQWNYKGTKGLIQLPANQNGTIFQAPYIDHSIIADYGLEVLAKLKINATWTDTGTKENEGIEAANNREYELQVNTTLTVSPELLAKYDVCNVALEFGNIENRDVAAGGKNIKKPNATFSNDQTTIIIPFERGENQTTKLKVTYAAVKSGTSWWNESYYGNWAIPITATLINVSEASPTDYDQVTLNLEPLNKTKVTFRWIGKNDYDKKKFESSNQLVVNVTGVPDQIYDSIRGENYTFNQLPKQTNNAISVIQGTYQIELPNPLLGDYGAPRNRLKWAVDDVNTHGVEEQPEPPIRHFEGSEATVYAVYEDIAICNLNLKFHIEGAELPSDVSLTATTAKASGYAGKTGTFTFSVNKQSKGSEMKLIGEIAKEGTITLSVNIPPIISYYQLVGWNITGKDYTQYSPQDGTTTTATVNLSHPGNTLGELYISVELEMTLHYQRGNFSLTISVKPDDAKDAGCTTDPSPGEHWERGGTTVNVKAYDAGDYDFDYWKLDGVNNGSAISLSVFIDGNKSLIAYFKYTPPSYTLKIRVDPFQAGEITVEAGGTKHIVSTNASYTYEKGTTISISQSTSTGFTFNHWVLDGTTHSTLSSVTMDTDHTLTAVYTNNLGEYSVNLLFCMTLWPTNQTYLWYVYPSYVYLTSLQSVLPDAKSVEYNFKMGFYGYIDWQYRYKWYDAIYSQSSFPNGVVFYTTFFGQKPNLGGYDGVELPGYPVIIQLWSVYITLTDGTRIHVLLNGSDSWYGYPDATKQPNFAYLSVEKDSEMPDDPPLTVYSSKGDLTQLSPLYCDLTGLALYVYPVGTMRDFNFSLLVGVYNVTAPARLNNKIFSHWVDAKTNKTLGTSTTLTINLTEATTVIAVYTTPEQANVQAAIAPILTFAAGLVMVLTFRKRRRAEKALSSILAAIIFFVFVVPMIISIIVFVPRLNQAIKTSSDIQQLITEKAKENLETYVYLFDPAAGTIVIQAANTGSVEITITHALVINCSGTPPVKTYEFQAENSSMAVGSIHFFIIGPATPEDLGLNPEIPTSWNPTPITAYETISLVSKRGNLFSTTSAP